MKKPKQPRSQIQEVLYALITRINITRRQMMLSYSVLNLPQQIHLLRHRHGLKIDLKKITVKNKFDREIEFGEYSISDKLEARKIYNKMQSEQKALNL